MPSFNLYVISILADGILKTYLAVDRTPEMAASRIIARAMLPASYSLSIAGGIHLDPEWEEYRGDEGITALISDEISEQGGEALSKALAPFTLPPEVDVLKCENHVPRGWDTVEGANGTDDGYW